MNAAQPVRRFCFPRAALLRHMRFWSKFVENVRKNEIGSLPPRLRTYIETHRLEVIMYLCALGRNDANLFPRDQRERFLDFLKEVYLSPVEPPPPNPTQHNPNARHWWCGHCDIVHRLNRDFELNDLNAYKERMGEEGVDQMDFPYDDYK